MTISIETFQADQFHETVSFKKPFSYCAASYNAMMAVKTGHSDIIANEPSCHILNKLNLLQSEIIIYICANFYNKKSVETAEQMLFLSVFHDKEVILKYKKGTVRDRKILKRSSMS